MGWTGETEPEVRLAWFRKEKRGPKAQPKKVIPDDLWIKCESCGETLYRNELEKNLNVCPRCDYHYGLTPEGYIDLLLDHGTFKEYEAGIRSKDPLVFFDRSKYTDRLEKAMASTGRNEAVVTGEGALDGMKLQLAVMDFAFIGGSMGSVVGEKISTGGKARAGSPHSAGGGFPQRRGAHDGGYFFAHADG